MPAILLTGLASVKYLNVFCCISQGGFCGPGTSLGAFKQAYLILQPILFPPPLPQATQAAFAGADL